MRLGRHKCPKGGSGQEVEAGVGSSFCAGALHERGRPGGSFCPLLDPAPAVLLALGPRLLTQFYPTLPLGCTAASPGPHGSCGSWTRSTGQRRSWRR